MWPARGIAEYAYCPRLFYFMAVEGVFLPSFDTEQGAGVHRRVDKPSHGVPPTPAMTAAAAERRAGEPPSEADQEGSDSHESGGPRSIRSLTLTSDRLELTAILDLAEIDGMVAVPVEYRKGRPRRTGFLEAPTDELMDEAEPLASAEPWPTDRVQLGLQVLLLEEAGYTVPEAWLYYAAEKSKIRVTVDDSLRADALEALTAAKLCASGARPAPLVNDPKCPRCSLQPICLPDEINHQRTTQVTFDGMPLFTGAPSEPNPPRRMWPPRDDGIQVVVQRDATKVGVRGESLRVTDREGAVVREVPLANVESLAVLGSVQLSTQAIGVLASHEIPVAFLSAAGRLVALIDPLGPVSAATRRAQVRALDRPDAVLALARAVVIAKISNQRTLLMRNHVSLLPRVATGMLESLSAAEQAKTVDELRGHEGQAAALYFGNFAGMIKQPAAEIAALFDAHGRQRRPPPDPINAVLSFGYSMLVNETTSACRLASLDPAIGALHVSRPGRPALALDLMEPFRALIADSIAISAFNRGELVDGHFVKTAAGCAMTDHGRKAFFGAYGRRMATEVTHPVFEYRLSYRRMLMLHARLVAAWVLGDLTTLAFLTTR